MKRLNPDTCKPFVRGDTRADGFLFLSYHKTKMKKDGFFQESWVRPEVIQKQDKNRSDWAKKNRLRVNKHSKQYRKNNADKKNALTAKRRSSKLNRTPKWLTKAHFESIKEFYIIAKMFQLYTGELYHVDHIVPLQGETVSGLHVPWNLQVLPWKENIKKSNQS